VESFLEQIRGELIERSYVPLRARKKEIPKEGSNKVRTCESLIFSVFGHAPQAACACAE
jgi:hypothetical protein